VAGGPAAVTVASGPVEIFVQSTGGTAYERTNAGTWSAWISLGGVLTTSPTATSQGAGASWAAVGGTDGRLWQDSYTAGAWSGWQPLPFG
jgi:hypothetical protein